MFQLRIPLFRLATLLATLSLATARADDPPSKPLAGDLSLRELDLDGHVHAIGRVATQPVALVFLGTECPISNRYVPLLNDLAKSAHQKNVELLGIISDPTVSRSAAKDFRDKYAASFPILFDASGALARALKPAVVPEAFVVDPAGAVLYHGRIDDGYASVARQKEQIEHHELADAIDAVGSGTPLTAGQTTAVGCVFEAWDKKPAPESITYTRNVAPILIANCVDCHHAGEVAPFSLTSYSDAAKHAKQISQVTKRRFMPPWQPANGFGHFAGERRLSDDEIAVLSTWAQAGAPEGDAADLPPAPTFSSGWRLGEPDLVVTMPDEFEIPAAGRDVYRAFVLPLDLPDDVYVSGFQFLPGAPSVVHHSLLYLDTTGQGRRLQAASGKAGYEAFGGIGFLPSGALGGWAPGAFPYMLPEGEGRPVKKGSDLVMQIHYHPDGRPHSDKSSVALYFAKGAVERVVGFVTLANRNIDIAPGDANYVRTKSITLPMDLTVEGITPHMHLLGKEMKVTATQPDGSLVPLIWIKDWDFNWQGQYRYAQPVKLPKGTRLDLRAVYDNSADNPSNPNAPPQHVGFGEQTTDEMCFCFLSIVADSPDDLRAIKESVRRAN